MREEANKARFEGSVTWSRSGLPTILKARLMKVALLHTSAVFFPLSLHTLLLAKALPEQENGPGQASCSRQPEVLAFDSRNIATIGMMT